jgi:hypothetical protein
MALAEKYEETPRYTWADYLEWDEDVRMELVDGYFYGVTAWR